MNQLCKVCGEPAAGFHFGAFTCEGCKSFFGRTYNNISAIAGCKNNGECVINKKNRTSCKACRLRKCLLVGMSKSGSRYGRRSNWFKIHCLLQEQQTQQSSSGSTSSASLEQLQRLQQIQAKQTYQDKTNPCIKTVAASSSPTLTFNCLHHQKSQENKQNQLSLSSKSSDHSDKRKNIAGLSTHQQEQLPQPGPPPPPNFFNASKFFNGIVDMGRVTTPKSHTESRFTNTPSDSGASSADDPTDDGISTASGRNRTMERNCNSTNFNDFYDDFESREFRRKHFLQMFHMEAEPLRSPFLPVTLASRLPTPLIVGTSPTHLLPALKDEIKTETLTSCDLNEMPLQNEPIDLSVKSSQQSNSSPSPSMEANSPVSTLQNSDSPHTQTNHLSNVVQKTVPLDLTLPIRSPHSLSG